MNRRGFLWSVAATSGLFIPKLPDAFHYRRGLIAPSVTYATESIQMVPGQRLYVAMAMRSRTEQAVVYSPSLAGVNRWVEIQERQGAVAWSVAEFQQRAAGPIEATHVLSVYAPAEHRKAE